MGTCAVFKKILQAKESLLTIERKIDELPPPVNTGVHVHVLELTMKVRLASLDIDYIHLQQEILWRDLVRAAKEFTGLRGVVNSVLWWRQARAWKTFNSLTDQEETLERSLDLYHKMIPLLESRLTMLE